MIDTLRDRLASVPAWLRRGVAGVALVLFAVAVLAGPLNRWWTQRNEISESERALALLEADNEDLAERLEEIADPATVERIARRDLALVRAGEESYLVLPPPTAGLVLPDTWPFDRVAEAMSQGQ